MTDPKAIIAGALRKPRLDRGSESRFMAESGNWIMVRRPGCIPYVVFRKDWLAMPLYERATTPPREPSNARGE